MISPVNTKDQLIGRLVENRSKLINFGVIRLGIFGSFVRDEVRENSDVDFYVELESASKTFDNFVELSFFLNKITGRKVELITAQSLSKYIGPHILKEVEYVSLAA